MDVKVDEMLKLISSRLSLVHSIVVDKSQNFTPGVVLVYKDVKYKLTIYRQGNKREIFIKIDSISKKSYGAAAGGENVSDKGDATLLLALTTIYLDKLIRDAGGTISYWTGEFSDYWRSKNQICCGQNTCRCWENDPEIKEIMTGLKPKLIGALKKKQTEEISKIRQFQQAIISEFKCPIHRAGCNEVKYNNACEPTGDEALGVSYTINSELFLEWSMEYVRGRGVSDIEQKLQGLKADEGGAGPAGAMAGGGMVQLKKRNSKKNKSKRKKPKKMKTRRKKTRRKKPRRKKTRKKKTKKEKRSL